MKTLLYGASLASALCLVVACGDDDDNSAATGGAHATGGASAKGGASAVSGGQANGGAPASGGTSPSGGKSASGGASSGAGTGNDAGAPAGGTNPGAGGAGGDAGATAAGAPAITCEPPPPPNAGSEASGGAGGSGAENAAGAGGAASALGLAIVGSYVDDFGGTHSISDASWMSDSSVYHIAIYDNAAHYVVARNDQANTFNPCAWSRFDWTRSAGHLYFCTTAYNAASESAAIATPAPDASNPSLSGCSGFAWSELTPQ